MKVRRMMTADEIAEDVTRRLKEAPDRPDDYHITCTVEDGKVTLTGDVRYAWDDPPSRAPRPRRMMLSCEATVRKVRA